MLAITTDYARDTGDPSPDLRRIAEAGFSHIHWCHQWNTDFLYSRYEIAQIQEWLDEYGLTLLDLHGSAGNEKAWASPQEYQRLSGVELVRNRIEMTSRLSADVVIMHVPGDPESVAIRRSLDELEPCCRERHVRIAIENGNFDAIGRLLSEYDPAYLGLCYDSGHGNLDAKWRKRVPDLVPASLRPLLERFPPEGGGLDELELVKNRLISVHLHDNDGQSDLHNPIFSGTVDWPRLARILATSSYTGPVSMEVTLVNSGFTDEAAFLAHAFDTGTRFAGMIGQA
jgi:sugar phosphate isomerase/epimerase